MKTHRALKHIHDPKGNIWFRSRYKDNTSDRHTPKEAEGFVIYPRCWEAQPSNQEECHTPQPPRGLYICTTVDYLAPITGKEKFC